MAKVIRRHFLATFGKRCTLTTEKMNMNATENSPTITYSFIGNYYDFSKDCSISHCYTRL